MHGSRIWTPEMNALALIKAGQDRGQGYASDLFERITDLLADLVLEDLKRYPDLSSAASIDRLGGRENTSLLGPEAIE